MSVSVNREKKSFPTYPLGEPEKNPLFFDKRVYQGSSGKVYPVPFVDKVYDEPIDVDYDAVTLENEYVRLELLPEIGGRIFSGQDKSNGNYDFFYRHTVIKPALVGLAGPWISGGVEFNWPQHHRPGTYLPCDVFIEEESDGAKTVWMSSLDPITRMKGMHGVRLRADSCVVELRVRLFNRTSLPKTFLWWANVAAKTHERYQSFFPPDVTYVADHAVRAMSSFPEANGLYYGVDYAARSGAKDLSWYRNIPVPTSYMICDTAGSFFGGYDFEAEGGFVHYANRHLSPGKKQWTWGNHKFGWAWDRELSDDGAPYVELMAGVFTDNQPDFSYLLPYETKTFSQYWWPLKGTGPVHEANEEAALRFEASASGEIDARINVARERRNLKLQLRSEGQVLEELRFDLKAGILWRAEDLCVENAAEREIEASLFDETGRLLLSYRAKPVVERARSRELAKEPPPPEELTSSDELYFVGEHLDQYRHPTRDPELYWKEALRRDEGDARARLSLGRKALERGDWQNALGNIQKCIERETRFHPNPRSGEAFYLAGVCQLYLNLEDKAYDCFYKATWNGEWRSAAYCEIALLDLKRGDAGKAAEHAQQSLKVNADNASATVALAIAWTREERRDEAIALLESWLQEDPLDPWALCHLSVLKCGRVGFCARIRNDGQIILDVIFEYARAGEFGIGLELIEWHRKEPIASVAVPDPMVESSMFRFAEAWLLDLSGESEASREILASVDSLSADTFFPIRLQEARLLEWALAEGESSLACYGLGNFLYHFGRKKEAIDRWEQAVSAGTKLSQVFRNLGIAYWNTEYDSDRARSNYERALEFNPSDGRLVFEYDQLRKKTGAADEERRAFLETRMDLVLGRDDACVEYLALLNGAGRHEEALAIMKSRRFHPWEGGEGKVLRQYTLAKLGIGQSLLKTDPQAALESFLAAMEIPENLGEAYHLHQAKADVDYWLGEAYLKIGDEEAAKAHFSACAEERGDFEGMEVVEFSELSYFSGRALMRLDRAKEAEAFFKSMLEYVAGERNRPATLDYFATSLPNLLVFEDDLEASKERRLDRLEALARKALADEGKLDAHGGAAGAGS